MGILISESSTHFHVPYGPDITYGSLEARFIDLKTNPQMIPVLPPLYRMAGNTGTLNTNQ